MFTLRKYFKNIIFVLYSVIIFFLYYSGIIKKMIHPRMYNFILISGFLLLIFFFIEVMFLQKDKLKRIKLSNIFYIIPLVLVFFINDADLSNGLIKNKGIDIGITTFLKDKDDNEEEDKQPIDQGEIIDEEPVVDEENKNETPNEENEPVKEDLYENIEMIELNDNDFLFKMGDISYEPDKFTGKKITYTGIIYRDNTMQSHQFVVGRLAMSCCAADAGLVGFLATYDKYSELKDKEWYKIEALIDKTIYKDSYGEYEVVYLKIYKITKASKPADEYVY